MTKRVERKVREKNEAASEENSEVPQESEEKEKENGERRVSPPKSFYAVQPHHHHPKTLPSLNHGDFSISMQFNCFKSPGETFWLEEAPCIKLLPSN